MTHAAPQTTLPDQAERIGLISVAEYHRMIDGGELGEEDNIELIEGRLVKKMSRNPPHDGTIQLIQEVLLEAVPKTHCVRIQCALTTLDSEPEPDLVVAKGNARSFLSRHPEPRDIALVVEIAYSTLRFDRRDKGRVYARGGVPIYWLVNLVKNRIEVYSEPDMNAPEPRYTKRVYYESNESVSLIIDGREIAKIPAKELLP